MERDHGVFVRKETGRDTPRMVRFDRMASFLAPYENAAAMEVARELDRKVETILQRAAV
jgi:hypothetical protein